VNIANADDELAQAIALRRHAEGGDGRLIGDSTVATLQAGITRQPRLEAEATAAARPQT